MRKLICVFLLLFAANCLAQDISTNYNPKISYAVAAGYGMGTKILGSTQSHEMALNEYSISYDWKDLWQPMARITEGYQYSPVNRNVTSLDVGIKYNWYKYNKFVSYIQPEVGIAYTDIRHPDLNGAFQFALGTRVGAKYLFSDTKALFLEVGWQHFSNASTSNPNKGVNIIPLIIGMEFKF